MKSTREVFKPTKPFTIRLTKEELEILKKLAKKHTLGNVGEYIRQAVFFKSLVR